MSLAVLAQHMASKGRGDDSVLIHMTPKEVAGLQSLAMAHGGSLTINPETGLPEAGFLSSILPMVAGFALGPAGFGLMSSLGAAATVGGITALTSGSLSRGLMAGLGAYGGAGLAEGMMRAGAGALTDAAASSQYSNMASTMTEEAAKEAGFGSVEEAAQNAAAQASKSASFSNADKLSAGWDIAKANPMEFVKGNAMPLLAATAPILADEGVQTTTKAAPSGYIRPYTYDRFGGGYTAQTPVKADEWGSRQFANGGIVALAGGGFTNEQIAAYIRDNNVSTPEQFTALQTAAGITADQVSGARNLLTSGNLSGVNQASADYARAVENRPDLLAQNNAYAASFGLPTLSHEVDTSAVRNQFGTDQIAAYMHDQGVTSQEDIDRLQRETGFTNAQIAAAQGVLTSGNTAGARAASKAYADAIAASPSQGLANEALMAEHGILTRAPIAWANPATANTTQAVPDAAIGTIAGTSTPVPESVISSVPGGVSAATPVPDAVVNTVGGVSGFTTNPLTLAQTQIAEQGATKTAANNALLAMFRTYITANPNATPTDLANYIDKIGLPPEVAAQATGMSPQQFKTAYFDAKFNKMTGDSQAAYNYLMGKGAYPTKSLALGSQGELARPYDQQTLGYPAPAASRMLWNPTTRTYSPNPDYVPVTYDPTTREKIYGMSDTAARAYLAGNPGNTQAQTITWAAQNNIPVAQLAALLGKPISEIQAAYAAAKKTIADAAVASRTTGVVDYTGAGASGGVSIRTGGRIRAYAQGGISSLGAYSDGGQLLRGPGDGVSDSIPATIGRGQKAALADGEFVIPARIVSELGNGSTEAGSRALYKMLDRVQHARKKSIGKNSVAANSNAAQYLPA